MDSYQQPTTPNAGDGIQFSSNQSFHLNHENLLNPIEEEEDDVLQKPKLFIELKNQTSSPSLSSCTIKKNMRGSVPLFKRSSKTPGKPPIESIENEICNPQVKSMLKQNTIQSQTSKIKPSRLQRFLYFKYFLLSLSHSIKASRVVPEDFVSSHQSVDDSFFESSMPVENNDQGRYRYDTRYWNLKYIIFPDDPFRIAWDLILLITLIYICLVIPYNIAFESDTNDWETSFGFIVSGLYFIDIILNFFTAYVDEQEELQVNRIKIIKNYLFGWFILDIITVFPFEYVIEDLAMGKLQVFAKLPRFYRLGKLLKMTRIVKLFQQRNQYSELLHNISNISINIRIMIISFITVIIVSHIFSCFWYFIGVVGPQGDNWVDTYLTNEGDIERYVISFYWVLQTLSTTGYGDISAINSSEQLIACFIMIIGVIFFSVTIGSVSSLLTQLDSKNIRLKDRMDLLNEVTKKYKLENTLYQRISKVLKFGYKNNQNEYVEFLNSLPQNLRIELSLCMYKNTLLGIDLFKDKPVRFSAYIGPLLTVNRYPEEDVIYNTNDYANEIYFIKSGTVALCIKEYDYHPFYWMKEGQYFGEIDLLFGEQRKYTAIAQTNCELLSLSKSNFSKIFFSEFKEIGQELHQFALKHKLIQQEKYKNCVAYLQGLEQQIEDPFESPTKKKSIKPQSSLEKFKKNWALSTQAKKGFLSNILDKVIGDPNPDLSMRMTRLKTVLITKGIINEDQQDKQQDGAEDNNSVNLDFDLNNYQQLKQQDNDGIYHEMPTNRNKDDLNQSIEIQPPPQNFTAAYYTEQKNQKLEKKDTLTRRRTQKSLTFLMKEEETPMNRNSSIKNIQFFKRKGKQIYL